MRVVENLIRDNNHTVVECLDEPGAGGACHVYVVKPKDIPDGESSPGFATIKFQEGVLPETGANGCFNEDLLAIVRDRLQHFAKGPFPSRETSLALTKVEEAIHWLNHRTSQRTKRGVEGKHVK